MRELRCKSLCTQARCEVGGGRQERRESLEPEYISPDATEDGTMRESSTGCGEREWMIDFAVDAFRLRLGMFIGE